MKSLISIIKIEVRKSLIFSKFLMLVTHFQKKKGNCTSIKRSKVEITEIEVLSENLPLIWNHPIIDNNYYGINNVLAKYAGVKNVSNKIYAEHGLVFGTFTYDIYKTSFADRLMTFSIYRKEIIEESRNYPVISIGPYIHYAESILTFEQFNSFKNKYKKTLLVFPSHSIAAVNAEFDVNEFILNIKEKSKNFDTVMICMYWKDIRDGKADFYIRQGFKVVTAGHVHDPYFLNRLKSIILLSDYTMSNDIGTHIGYCLYLNKPHYIYSQRIEKKLNLDPISFKKEIGVRNEKDKITFSEIKTRILEIFNQFENEITNEQKEIVSYIWGFDQIKTPSQLKKIIR